MAIASIEARLARRLRIDDGAASSWRESVLLGDPTNRSLSTVYKSLVANARLDDNETQAAAIEALMRIPGPIAAAREAGRKFDAEKARLTALAEEARERAERLRAELEKEKEKGFMSKIGKRSEIKEKEARLQKVENDEARALQGIVALGIRPRLQPGGVYLHGTVGTGKTTIMDLFSLFGREGWRVQRQHFHEFSLWLHESLARLGGKRIGGEENAHVLERVADSFAANADVLCLDEFAVTNVADAAIFAKLLHLLAERYVPVVVTTNRPPEDLYKGGLHSDRHVPKLVAELRESFIVTQVAGPDYRAELLAHEQEATSKQSPAAPVEIQTQAQAGFFNEGGCPETLLKAFLTADGQSDASLLPGQLTVSWGRKLVVPKAGAGFACFHFDDLCRKDLGAEDFFYVASNYHTVFVHNIPQLALEEHNEARRFTNLVDALYEHSVRMLCHSEGVALDAVLSNVEVLQDANSGDHDAERLGVFETMYDDTPNFQLQIKEMGSAEKYRELMVKKRKEEMAAHAQRLARMQAPDAAEGDTGSAWSSAPAASDFSAPQEGVAGVMVAAVGSLQESGFAAKRAISRLKEMQTAVYLQAAAQRRAALSI